jgi:hypothetical protein
MDNYSDAFDSLNVLGALIFIGLVFFEIWSICNLAGLSDKVKTLNQILEDVRYKLEIPHTNFCAESKLGGWIDEFGNEYFEIFNINIENYGPYFGKFHGHISADKLDKRHQYPIAVFNSRNVKIGTLSHGNKKLYDYLQNEGDHIAGTGFISVTNGSMYYSKVHDYYGYFYLGNSSKKASESIKETLKS